jgi:hypothetical protein
VGLFFRSFASSAHPDKPNGNGAPAVEDKAPALTGAE